MQSFTFVALHLIASYHRVDGRFLYICIQHTRTSPYSVRVYESTLLVCWRDRESITKRQNQYLAQCGVAWRTDLPRRISAPSHVPSPLFRASYIASIYPLNGV